MMKITGFFRRLVGSNVAAPWPERIQAAYPILASAPGNPEYLRLILGVGRSGTSWVSQVLARTRRPLRFYLEPLFHIEPPLSFHETEDHTAVGYGDIGPSHPLLLAYRLVTHRQFDGRQVKVMRRDDVGWELCLVKEVHALLGTEGLLRAWKTPALFILRDPVYVIDSLFAAQTLQTHYLGHEVEAVQAPAFLDRFAPRRRETVLRLMAQAAGRGPRERLILQRVICAQLLQDMFTVDRKSVV
jgi:hypothetical protein